MRAATSPPRFRLVRAASYELITEAALTDQIVAQTLAGRAREALEEAYPAYLGRLAQLTGTAADEDSCPLGAKALATALVTAVRPFSSDPLTRDQIEAALLKHAVIPIREIIAAADRKMAEQGILSNLPRIVVFPGLRKAVEGAVTRSARGIGRGTRAAPAGAGGTAGRVGTACTRARALSVRRQRPQPRRRTATVRLPGRSRNRSATDDAGTTCGGDQQARDAFAGTVAVAARKVVRDAKASMILGAHPMVGTQDPRSAFRQAELLPGTDSLERDAIAFAHQVGHPPFSTAARARSSSTSCARR